MRNYLKGSPRGWGVKMTNFFKIDASHHKGEGELRDQAMTFLVTFLCLSASLLVVGSLLVTSYCYELIMGSIAIVCLAIVEGMWVRDRTILFISCWSAILIVLLLPRMGSQVVRLLVLALYLGGLEILRLRSYLASYSYRWVYRVRLRASLLPLILSLVALSVLIWISSKYEVWFLVQRVADLGNWGSCSVGFSASGGEIYLLAGLVIFFSFLLEPSLKTGIALASLFVSFVLGKRILMLTAPVTALKLSLFHIACLAWCSFLVARFGRITDPRASFPRAIPVILAIVVCSLGVGSWLNRFSLLAKSSESAIAKACAMASSSARSNLCQAKRGNLSPPRYQFHPDILVYQAGLLDWNSPSPERVGLINAGMFGLFRRGLERLAESRDGRLLLADSLTYDCLSNAWLAVFINPTRRLTQDELRLLHRFIKDGGSMLVLGDHTDIGGSRSCLNSLLSVSEIEFNFDSAIGLRKHWRGCLEIRPHPITEGIPNEIFVQIAVGASLKVGKFAEPIIVGRYGFSDKGDYRNGGRRAFMGNTSHERHEKLGDLVLVACQKIGNGRVLVFGDTSPFQNGALFYTWRLIENSIAWLAGIDSQKQAQGLETRGLPIAEGHSPDLRWNGFADEKAIIDFGLMPKASLEPYQDNSLGGLANSLAKVGVEARAAASTHDWLQDAKYLFIVSPTKSISDCEKEILKRFMDNGGWIVLALDHVNCKRVGICQELGLTIDPIPLGSGEESDLVAHKEAWPIVGHTSQKIVADTLVLATAFGYPTTVLKRCGKGGLVLISDARMLFDENLESERTGKLVNIKFVKRLVEAMRLIDRGG